MIQNLFCRLITTKRSFGLVLAGLVASANVWAGGYSVGNGGVIWGCVSGVGDSQLHQGLLVDLFEATEIHNWPTISTEIEDPEIIYQSRKDWLAANLPEFSEALASRFAYVENNRQFINAALIPTDDVNPFIYPLPSRCPQGVWKPINIANFREDDGRVLINAELWQSPVISSLDKAALLFHEAIYYWMRKYFGATDSVKSRAITGLLFSNLAPEQMRREITDIVGSYGSFPEGKFVCTLQHNVSYKMFIGFAETLWNAELEVGKRCAEEPNSNDCGRSPSCEKIEGDRRVQCNLRHPTTGKIFEGSGRNKLEAQFYTFQSCYIGSLNLDGHKERQCSKLFSINCN